MGFGLVKARLRLRAYGLGFRINNAVGFRVLESWFKLKDKGFRDLTCGGGDSAVIGR